MTKYDDASWHSDGDFPEDLPPEAGATHIGMFYAWAQFAGLTADDRAELRERTMTPGAFMLRHHDGKLLDEDLTEEGNAFTESYYKSSPSKYMRDFVETLLDDLPSAYHVTDTWATFDRLKPVLDHRLGWWRAWRNRKARRRS